MSQEKVDKKKQLKRNREAIAKQNKRKEIIGIVIGAVVAVALVAWIGISVYQKAEDAKLAKAAEETTDVDLSAIDDYLNEVDSEDEDSDVEVTTEDAEAENVETEDAESEDETAEDDTETTTEEEPEDETADAEDTAEE